MIQLPNLHTKPSVQSNSFSATDAEVAVVVDVFDRVNCEDAFDPLRNRPSSSRSRPLGSRFRSIVAERRTLLTTFAMEGSAVRRTASRKRDPAADTSPLSGEGVSVLSAEEGEAMRCAGTKSWNVTVPWPRTGTSTESSGRESRILLINSTVYRSEVTAVTLTTGRRECVWPVVGRGRGVTGLPDDRQLSIVLVWRPKVKVPFAVAKLVPSSIGVIPYTLHTFW